jgi:hypothetical protein
MTNYVHEMQSYQCPWCVSAEQPAGLTMYSYPHQNGVLVAQGDGSASRQWVYGECETCGHQWALWKLRSMQEVR